MTDNHILRIIGRNIRQARLKENMTQECLAELVGIHWKTLGYIERGRYPFAITTFALLVLHLGVSANRLLDGLPEPSAKRIAAIRKAKARKRRPPG